MKKIVNVNKIKSWFFEKINKIDKPLASSSRKKERRIKSTKLEIKRRGYKRQCRSAEEFKRLF